MKTSILDRFIQFLGSVDSVSEPEKPSILPESYLKGYRRLSKEGDDVVPNKCWTCRHAVAYVTWHCDLPSGCRYEKCFSEADLTKDEKKSHHWLGLPK